MTTIRMLWRAWYGDEELALPFPSDWQVRAYRPQDASDVSEEAIREAFDHPIGTAIIEELARGKKTVAIAVEDISRPVDVSRIMPELLRRLVAGGVDLDQVPVVLGVGMHRPMVKEDIVKKMGAYATERLEVHNNHPYEGTVYLGTTPRGTPVHVSRLVAEADLKIGVGGITPHGAPGFAGGAKVFVPGVAGIETIVSIHAPGRLKGGLGQVPTDFREEIEHIAQQVLRVDCIVNAVPTARRGIAGLVVGDVVAAHRAGIPLARQVFGTPMPSEPADVVICNAYPKDTDYLQAGLAQNPLNSSPTPVVKPDGSLVIITASPEGRGYHGVFGPGMRYGPQGQGAAPRAPGSGEGELLFFAPGVSRADTCYAAHFKAWDEVVAHLQARFQGRPQPPTVAVFPCAAAQLAEGLG